MSLFTHYVGPTIVYYGIVAAIIAVIFWVIGVFHPESPPPLRPAKTKRRRYRKGK